MNMTKHRKFPTRMLACAMVFTLALCPILNAQAAMAEPARNAAKEAVQNQAAHSAAQYQIDVRLDEQHMTLQGSEKVVFQNTTKDTLKELVFHTYADSNRSETTQSGMFSRNNAEIKQKEPKRMPEDFLGGIDINQVKSNGQALQFIHKNQALTVTLGKELKPGESITVNVDFKVKIPYGIQRISHYKDMISGAHWYPVMSVYDENKHQWDKTPYSTTFVSEYFTTSDYQVNMNVPASYQVLMPGTITEQANVEPGRKVVSTVANQSRQFVFFASPNYKVASETRDGLTVQYYYMDNFPGKKEVMDQYVDQAFKAIQFFSDKYGKYPYPEFRIAETYLEYTAFEFARVIQMGPIHKNVDVSQDFAFIHEIAHQWFHSLVGNNSETESFLDEGFADFSRVYFFEKQGDVLNGFKNIQVDELVIDKSIGAPNKDIGNSPSQLYYDKGRQAIYQLYRTVGEEKFDQFMKQYVKRYTYMNTSIDGLLQTIEDTLGQAPRDEMETALRQPNFVLKPEYQATEEEKHAFMLDQIKSMYQNLYKQNPTVPFESMSRIIDKALQGEPLTIVVGDKLTSAAKAQQSQLLEQMKMSFEFMGVKATVLSERQAIKSKLEKELATSNLIVIGNAKSNALIQAMKPGIMKRTAEIGFDWKTAMSKEDASGAYVVKHPYNQNRLMLNFFWTGNQLNGKALQPFMMKAEEVTNITGHFYQSYLLDQAGKLIQEKKEANPLSVMGENSTQ